MVHEEDITVQNQESPGKALQENGEKQEDITMKNILIEDQSPRGVLETSVSGSEHEQSNSVSSSISEDKALEKSDSLSSTLSLPLPLTVRGNNSNLNINIQSVVQLKSTLDNIKKKSVRRLSSVSLMNYYEQSRKSLRWKLGRSHASVDSFEWMMPKPSWRNFTLQELEAATKKFRPGIR